MSTTETTQTLRGETDSCEQCGAALTGGRFCSECGHPVAARNGHASNGHSATADAVTQIRPPAASPPAAGRRFRTPLIAGIAAAVAVIVIGVVAAVLLTSKDDG